MGSFWNLIAPNRKQELKGHNYQKEIPISDLVNMFVYQRDMKQTGYFHTKDGRFAKVWRLTPYDMSVLNQEGTLAVSNSFAKLLNEFPSGSAGQLLRLTRRDPSQQVAAYLDNIQADESSIEYKLSEAVAQKQIGAMMHPDGFFRDYSRERLERAKNSFTEEMSESETVQENFVNIDREMRQGKYPLNHDLYLVFIWEPSYLFGKMLQNNYDKFRASISQKAAKSVVEKSYSKYRDEFFAHCTNIERRMTTDSWRPQVVSGQGMIDLIYTMLNPDRSKRCRPPKYRPSMSIIDNLVRSKNLPNAPKVDERLNIPAQVGYSNIFTSEKGVRIENKGKSVYHRATSMIGRPDNTFPGMLHQALSSTDGDSIIAINFHVTPELHAKVRLGAKRWAGETILNFRASHRGAQQQIAEVDEVNHIIDSPSVNERQKMIDASIHVISMDESEEEAEDRAEFLTKSLFDIGYYETKRGDAIFHSALPGNFNTETMGLLERDQPYLSRNLADLCPLLSEFQGVSFDSKAMLVNNRDGTPIFFDLFNGDEPAHALIVGGTGSGKSFAFNNILSSLHAYYKPKIFLFDKGRSYESYCQSVGGSYIDLTVEEVFDEHTQQTITPTCINPLYTEIDKETGKRLCPSKEEYEFLTQLLINMITEGKPLTELTSMNPQSVRNAMYSSLRDFFVDFTEKNHGKEATLGDYIPYLKKIDRQEVNGQAVVDMMEMYYGNGPYAAIFDGELSVNWDADMCVLETGRMASSPALSSVILCLFHQIDTYCKFRKPLDRKAIVAVDEAWAALNNPVAADALGGYFREMRKYSCAVVLISQGVRDFVKLVNSESGSGAEDGILINTKTLLFLKCSDDDYAQAVEHLGFSDTEIEKWHSLASAPPYFSEIFYRYREKSGSIHAGVFRLYASSYSIWMSTTAGSDKTIRERRVAEKISKGLLPQQARIEAITELAEEYPFGVKFS